MKAKYINPYTDFGFKKIFGEEASKILLIDFLNALLPEQNRILDLSFKNTEQLGLTDLDRKAIYDIYCENDRGEKFIVELQKAKQNYFRERTIYYSTFPIREQAEKGNWNYNLKAVYCIGIDYDNEQEKIEFLHNIKLKNQHGRVFYDKLTYVYLEMPNFKKTESELKTRLDKWLYFIKHLEDFQTIPTIFKDEVFEQAFETAEIANFRQADLENYEARLKVFRDNKATYDYAVEQAKEIGFEEGVRKGIIEGTREGRIEGMKEGKIEGMKEGKREREIETAKVLLQKGIPAKEIAGITGLSEDEINKL